MSVELLVERDRLTPASIRVSEKSRRELQRVRKYFYFYFLGRAN
jgi:hypothetical protein